jgi:hypothetical protein
LYCVQDPHLLFFLQSSLKETISIGALWRNETTHWAKQMGDAKWPAEVQNTKKQDLVIVNCPKDTEMGAGGEDEDESSDDDMTLIDESIVDFLTSTVQGEEDEVRWLLAVTN